MISFDVGNFILIRMDKRIDDQKDVPVLIFNTDFFEPIKVRTDPKFLLASSYSPKKQLTYPPGN